MADFFELDFLDVEAKKSGDAIAIRYQQNDVEWIHIVDGGYQACGEKVCSFIDRYYREGCFIDHVVVTHSDGDHSGGLRTVLEKRAVGAAWMLRPWLYAEELLPRFPTYQSADALRARLRSIYSNLVALEEIALRRNIAIFEPFQGTHIGAFTVLSPSRATYLDLIAESERTPESRDKELLPEDAHEPRGLLAQLIEKAITFVRALWGDEAFSPNGTSAENEMSVVQYARICNRDIVLTGDAGRRAMSEAADYAPAAGLVLPGVDHIQVPHHGSRRNVSTELLDRWLGPRLAAQPAKGSETFNAICSAAKEDEHHPRKAVKRGFIHRGAKFLETKGQNVCSSYNAQGRHGWTALPGSDYPDDYES